MDKPPFSHYPHPAAREQALPAKLLEPAMRLEKMMQLSVMAGNIGPQEIRAMRKLMCLTQSEFAEMFQLPKDTLVHWETGRRKPSSTAQALLRIIAYHPVMASAALNGRKSAFSSLLSVTIGTM